MEERCRRGAEMIRALEGLSLSEALDILDEVRRCVVCAVPTKVGVDAAINRQRVVNCVD